MKVKSLSRVRFFGTPWTVAHQAPPSMGFSRQEYWSELPFPSPGDLPDPGIEPRSPALQADALTSEPPGKPKGNYKQGEKTAFRLGGNNSKQSNRQRINLKNIQAIPAAQFQKKKMSQSNSGPKN